MTGAPTKAAVTMTTDNHRLEDRYDTGDGVVYLTGLQAIARAVIDSARRDRLAGRRVGTFISGYPGSPLGGFEGVVRSLGTRLEAHDVTLRPAVNEELAATAILGATKRSVFPPGGVDGVTGVWYGKCNGVDRCVDVFKYGNYGGMGSGDGVVVLAGDDPHVKSSGIPGESEHTLAAAGIPVLYPGSVSDIHRFFQHGVAMSRLSGCWVGLKLATDLCDGGATIEVGAGIPVIVEPDLPDGFVKYDTHFYFGGPILDGEESLFGPRHEVVRRYARTNRLDRIAVGSNQDRVAVIAAGKTFTDIMQAFADLGVDETGLQDAGIRLIQIGLIYPLDHHGVKDLLTGIERVLVIEEKRGIIEQQLRSSLYHADRRPVIIGKNDEAGNPLIPIRGELDADSLRPLLARIFGLGERPRRLVPIADVSAAGRRTPVYCSGCPHSRGTVSSSDDIVLGGIGCHSIGLFLPQPERHYEYNVQMGGEGAPWIGAAPYVGSNHIIQNLGDGTFYHSGSLAVRACVDAQVDITFRILYNGHISMTGGQDIPGTRGVAALTRELEAMGVNQTTVVTDRPGDLSGLAANARLVDESELADALDRLGRTPGVTVLLHDRECALERRRRWRRGDPAPRERLLINQRVCEGCGDCGAKSICPSLEPVSTEYGRKTRIQQSSCAIDRACLQGDCPAFVGVTTDRAVEPGRKQPPTLDVSGLQTPEVAAESAIFAVGIGGTGVSTVNAILAQAALMELRWAVSLDQTGLAQKGGPVATHLITASDPSRLYANKVSAGKADLILVFDLVEAGQSSCLSRADPDITAVVVDVSITPTGEMVRDVWAPTPDTERLLAGLAGRTRPDRRVLIPARGLAESLFGDHMKTNLLTLGAASQAGFLPVTPEAIEVAIGLNGVEVENNVLAFRYGRLWVSDRSAVERLVAEPVEDPVGKLSAADRAWLLDRFAKLAVATGERQLILHRAADLLDYADRRSVERYFEFLVEVSAAETVRPDGDGRLTSSVAQYLHKLMAYKDEYEIARLYLDPAWRRSLDEDFGGETHIGYYFHPPVLRRWGLERKLRLGAWFDMVLRVLRIARRLRGTVFDPFGRTPLRRLERSLPDWYMGAIRQALAMAPDTTGPALEVAVTPDRIRGYEEIKTENARRVMDEVATLLRATRP